MSSHGQVAQHEDDARPVGAENFGKTVRMSVEATIELPVHVCFLCGRGIASAPVDTPRMDQPHLFGLTLKDRSLYATAGDRYAHLDCAAKASEEGEDS